MLLCLQIMPFLILILFFNVLRLVNIFFLFYSRTMPRFIRKIKVTENKDTSAFGVSLSENVRKFGKPLPHFILRSLAHLRRTSLNQIGLFRKPGVRNRIARLRISCENAPESWNMDIFNDYSSYDVADMVKQYFRELPDALMTSKLSETFMAIFSCKLAFNFSIFHFW